MLQNTTDLESSELNSPAARTVSRPSPVESRSFQLEIYQDEQALGDAAAALLFDQISLKPSSVLLLPTGRTPLIMYSSLVKRFQSETRDLSRLQTFNLDEFYGLPTSHPGSYKTYMQTVLFNRLTIPTQNTHLPDSAAPDPLQEAEAYEATLKAAGQPDLTVLGIGANGHIGFNEPGSDLTSRTRPVTIQLETRLANSFLFNNRLEDVPEVAITVGVAPIMLSRRILLLVSGSSKAEALFRLLSGPVSSEFPASFLRFHSSVTVLADLAAAARI